MLTTKKLFILALIPFMALGSCKKDDDPTDTTPTILSSSPANNATEVSTSTAIEFTFSELLHPASVSNNSFRLFKDDLELVTTVVYSPDKVIVTPISALAEGTVYNVLVSTAVKSAFGTPMKNAYELTFTTSGDADTTPPTITSTSPLSDASGVVLNKTVSVVFSETMNAATVTTASFTLKQGGSSIIGTVFCSGNNATFKSTESLEPNKIYTATISTDVEDPSGNALENAFEWSFTTSNTSSNLAMVNLGGSGNFAILAKTAINNSSTSALVGDLGLSPAATSYITGLALVNATGYATSAQVTGNVYAADMASPTPVILTVAVNDMITAYNDAAGRPTPDFLELGTGNIGGQTLSAGLYKWTSTVTIPNDVTLSGSTDDVWIFQIAGDLNQSSATNITLTGGAQAKNIFWQVAGEAAIGANAHFEGNILSMTGITFLTGASLNGRALAQTAVVLDANAITKAE